MKVQTYHVLVNETGIPYEDNGTPITTGLVMKAALLAARPIHMSDAPKFFDIVLIIMDKEELDISESIITEHILPYAYNVLSLAAFMSFATQAGLMELVKRDHS